jgi:hypothetical protein
MRSIFIGAMQLPVPTKEFPVSAKAIPCFGAEQGILYNMLKLQRKMDGTSQQRDRNGRKSREFPAIFPVLREFSLA